MSETVKLILQRYADFAGTRKNHPTDPWDPWEVGQAIEIMDALATIVRDERPDALDKIAVLLRETHTPDTWDQPWPPGLRERIQAVEVLLLGGRGAGHPEGRTAIQELAEAAQGYPNSQEMVGHTEESRRALRQRLGQLIGPHLVAQCGARSSGGVGGP